MAALAITGAAFLSGRPRLIRPFLIGFSVLCLADWVLIEDLGFLGGLGTDPNSMIPLVLLAAGGYLALTRVAACPPEQVARQATPARAVPARAMGRSRVRPAVLYQRAVAASTRSVAALAGAGLILLGTVSMAVAQASPNASPKAGPILARVLVGCPGRSAIALLGTMLIDLDGSAVGARHRSQGCWVSSAGEVAADGPLTAQATTSASLACSAINVRTRGTL